LAQFPADEDGNSTVMRYIIRAQAEMADYWQGEKFYGIGFDVLANKI